MLIYLHGSYHQHHLLPTSYLLANFSLQVEHVSPPPTEHWVDSRAYFQRPRQLVDVQQVQLVVGLSKDIPVVGRFSKVECLVQTILHVIIILQVLIR